MNTRIGYSVQEAKNFLINGEIVAIPTETVYGLAGNALIPETVLQIFAIKERPSFDPLIVHISSIDSVDLYVHSIPSQAYDLMREFWPGPLTIVLPKKPTIPDIVSSGLDTVGLRMPNHPIALELLQQLNFPLAAPSANPFGYISPTTSMHVAAQLGDAIPYILDGGSCRVGLESTIVGMEGSSLVVYRLGGLSLTEIEECVGKCEVRSNESSNPRAPGMLQSHYAPVKKLIVGNLNELLAKNSETQAVLIVFGEYRTDYPKELQLNLSSNSNLSEAAANLFAFLRLADEAPQEFILAEFVPEQGLGLAINDRLRRASVN